MTSTLRALIPIVVTAAVLLLCMASAQGSPPAAVIYPECLDRDCHRDMRSAGAEPWEIEALCDVVASGSIGKTLVDYVRVSPNEIGLGVAHFTARRGRLGLSPPRPHVSDLDHYWRALAYLYSDESPPSQLRAWRRLVAPAVEEGDLYAMDRVFVAALANSGPERTVRMIRSCHGRVCCVARQYVDRRQGHRARRVTTLGLGRCLLTP